jgi:hypothetical protein
MVESEVRCPPTVRPMRLARGDRELRGPAGGDTAPDAPSLSIWSAFGASERSRAGDCFMVRTDWLASKLSLNWI